MIIINKIDFKSKNPTSNSGTFLLFETAKINLTFAVVGVLVISIFILFFTVEKNDIGKDISKKYENVVILSEKNTIATQIFFFSVGKAEIGIANYIKMPLLDRYYCQKHYVLDNTEEKPKINDVLQMYLRELRPADMQGSVGLYRLKEELLLRINKIVYPSQVNDLLFKEVLVQ